MNDQWSMREDQIDLAKSFAVRSIEVARAIAERRVDYATISIGWRWRVLARKVIMYYSNPAQGRDDLLGVDCYALIKGLGAGNGMITDSTVPAIHWFKAPLPTVIARRSSTIAVQHNLTTWVLSVSQSERALYTGVQLSNNRSKLVPPIVRMFSFSGSIKNGTVGQLESIH